MILHGDNLKLLKDLPSESVDLIYVDPPFNTGNTQKRKDLSYSDTFEDIIEFLRPRIEEAYRILKPTGSFFLHMDYREIHYAKIMCDEIFGRQHFINEIIWSYDYGARSKKRWPAKHDNILWYAKSHKYTFNYDEQDRIPYMAPALQTPERAAKGKTPTDVWFLTIVPTMGKEKTGYPTQKPVTLLRRIIKVHSNPEDTVLDFFAGSGTTGAVAQELNRKYILIDSNPQAINIIKGRLQTLI